MKRAVPALLLIAIASTRPSSAQEAAKAPPPPATPPAVANAADVATLDGIVSALYDVISGPAAQKRDWARMRSLFLDGARLIPTGVRPSGEAGSRVNDVSGYIERSAPFFEKEGFFEREVARRTERFGHIAHVFSTYEARHALDAAPFVRGINSIQLMNDGKRWWIVTVFWEAESLSIKLPERYLKTEPWKD